MRTIKYQSRKEIRTLKNVPLNRKKAQRNMALAGAALVAGSVVAPLAAPISAEATTTATASRSVNTAAFISEIGSYASGVAAANDLYASVMMAQAILESSWGSSGLASAPNYNLFGIKGSYNGQSVAMPTSEYLNGSWVTITDNFRKYPSYAESFADNAYVIKNTIISGSLYYSGAWKSNTSSYRDATAWLTGRYATDPNYATKLNTLISTYNLTQYDTGGSGSAGGGASTGTPSTSEGSGSTVSGTKYTVQSGDTLYRIAKNNGVSVTELKSWNSLSSDMIYVGQQLTVSTSSSGSSTGETGSESNSSATVNGKKYTVKAGDNLYRVALNNGVSMSDIKSWNNLTSDTIYIGQELTVSQSGGQAADSGAGSAGTSTETTKYTVKSGDNLYRIALNHGVSVADLKSWNNLSSDAISVGQELSINGSTSASADESTGATASGTKYTVKSGDNLYRIALNHGVSVADLKSWNNLSSENISVGQELVVNDNGTTASSDTTTSTNTASGSTTYTVKSGDNLYRIALNHGVSVADLKNWNNLADENISVGQTLAVNSSGAASASSTATSASVTADTSSTAVKKYTVQSGDNLYRIALNNNVSVDELKSWNNLTDENVSVGQELIVSKAATYTVQSGDTLYAIAKKHSLSVDKLKELNQLTSENITLGQELKVS